MKKLISIIAILLGALILNAQSAKYLWGKGYGGKGGEESYAVTVDNSGNSYSTGWFMDTVDFDPGPGISKLISKGVGDIFLSKLDAAGNLVWAKSFGGSDNDGGRAMATDALGNVFLTGWFITKADFGPFTLTAKGGVYDIDLFVLKIDPTGKIIWVKQFAGYDESLIYSLAIDTFCNVYTTGSFRGTVDFDPGTGTAYLSAASGTYDDIFVSKLDSSGNYVWAKSFRGGSYFNYGKDIDVDKSGNVYTTGLFYGTTDFDPGAPVYNLVSYGSADVFISKLDVNGNFVWAKKIGGIQSDEANSISLDGSGGLIAMGNFWGKCDFDPGSGTFNMTPVSYTDMYILKLDTSGNFAWAKQVGNAGGGYLKGEGLNLDKDKNIYTTGMFEKTVDFDPGVGVSNLVSKPGSQSTFVLKMDPSGNYSWAKMFGGDSCVAWGISIIPDKSGNVFVAGKFDHTVDFDPGAAISNLSSAGSTDIFVVKLANCQPTLGTASVTSCQPYRFNNTVYSVSGSYTLIGVNSTGCDSIITLQLTINPINDSVTKSGTTFTATVSGTGYQWVSCPSYSLIPGATAKSFTPASNGSYAVILKQGVCADTSACYSINGIGIDNRNSLKSITVEPNPCEGRFRFFLPGETEVYRVELFNMNGDLALSRLANDGINEVEMSNLPNGLYLLKIMTPEKQYITCRIVKD